MFAPDGFVCLVEICNVIDDMYYEYDSVHHRALKSRMDAFTLENWALFDDARRWALKSGNRFDDLSEDEEEESRKFYASDKATALAFALFIQSQRRNFYVCTHNFIAVRVASDLVDRATHLTLDDFPVDMGETHKSFLDKLYSPFYFVDRHTWTVDVSETDEKLELWNGDEWCIETARALQGLNGCPVCWKLPCEDLTKIDWIEIACDSTLNAASNPRKRGPASERLIALDAYRQVYPRGHDGIDTWSEVERRVGYSQSTIRRALAECQEPFKK